MNLPGRLKLTTLGDLLGALHRASASGVLELEESSRGGIHRVYLEAGLVDAVDSRMPAPRLGELLVKQGFLSLEGVRRLLHRIAEQPSKKTGEVLLEERLIDPSVVGAALRTQVKSRLDALFKLEDALIRFHVRRPRVGFHAAPLSPREFLHGRTRARTRAERAQAAPPEVEPHAYRLLGLKPGADQDSVRRRFRALAALHHPDRHPAATADEKTALVQRFSQISAAYHALCR